MSNISLTFKCLSEWLESDEAKRSYIDWVRKNGNDDGEEFSNMSSINDTGTHLDAILLYRVDHNGWFNDFNFNFNVMGRCTSVTYKSNVYHRALDNDPRNGEADGMYFYCTIYEENTGKKIYEQIRVWCDSYTKITIRRADRDWDITGWKLVNSIDI